MDGWYKSRKWSELTFTDLDKSYHDDENQSEEFAHSENVLDPRRPAHTAAVHPGEEYYTDTQTQLQSLPSLDRIKGTLLISVTSSHIVSVTQFSIYRPERFQFSISYTCTVSLCVCVCLCVNVLCFLSHWTSPWSSGLHACDFHQSTSRPNSTWASVRTSGSSAALKAPVNKRDVQRDNFSVFVHFVEKFCPSFHLANWFEFD